MIFKRRVAVVLGPGGPVGTAWELGLAAGLRRAGVELTRADLLVGTSAGAITAAVLATGRDLAEIAVLPPRDGAAPADPGAMPKVWELLRGPGEHRDKLRKIGELAQAAAALPEEQHVAGMRFLIGTDAWPELPLLVTGVDAVAGEAVVWDAGSGVPLPVAVAASSAAPGYAKPITIDGRPHLDGAFGGGLNAHLADGAETLILIEPLPTGGPETTGSVRIVPDQAARDAFGTNLGARDRWAPVWAAGEAQAPAVAEALRPYLG